MGLATFSHFRAPERHDSPWTQVRVESSSDEPDLTDWATDGVFPIEDPADVSISCEVAGDWGRLVFRGADSTESVPSTHIYVHGASFAPSVNDVASILRARTKASGFKSSPAGAETGMFSTATRPTESDVRNEIIPAAVEGVLLAAGHVPGVLIGRARRVAALKAAAEIERSFLPEQAEGSGATYQTLRITAEEEASRLATHLQWWVLANRKPS